MDEVVLRAPKWVNENYLAKNGYATISEDGITGQNTVKALIIALQIEIGVRNPAILLFTYKTSLAISILIYYHFVTYEQYFLFSRTIYEFLMILYLFSDL